MGKEIYLDVSPSNTKYLGFQSSRPDLGVVKIKASSATGSCMTLSIQPPHVNKPILRNYIIIIIPYSTRIYCCEFL